ncbi:MAG TPA: hypothetical protein VK308_05485, partial [Pyrinomonadaceae bacterium]|nr:hypothetical protein [Pyrinomonadaceae bacterium]
MDKLLAVLVSLLAVGVALLTLPDGPLAVLFGAGCAVIAIIFINKEFSGEEKIFVRRVFLIALSLRVILAAITYVFELQGFFGGDSITYDQGGFALYNSWFGYGVDNNSYYAQYVSKATGSGFGMAYIVAAMYTIVGKNP